MMPLMQEGQPHGLDHLRLGRGRRGDRADVERGGRQRDGRADGRDGPRHDGDLRRPDRRRLRRLAGRARFAGAGRVNEPGCARLERARHPRPRRRRRRSTAPFSAGRSTEHEMGDDGSQDRRYIEFGAIRSTALDRRHAGIGGVLPDEVPAHWLVYFGVEDTDAAIEAAKARVAASCWGPIDIPAGRFASSPTRTAPRLRGDRAQREATLRTQLSAPLARKFSQVVVARSSPPQRGRRPGPRPPIRPAGRGWRS